MTTTVVNIRNGDRYDVYIGRAVPRMRLKARPYANSYRIGRDGTRSEVLAKFRAHTRRHPELVARARRELRGKRLGCWCTPEDCHGDIWVEIVDLPAWKRQ